MSAYLVEPKQIGILAAFAVHNKATQYGPCYGKGLDELEDVVTCLAEGNLASVEFRYKETESAKGFWGISNREYVMQCAFHARRINRDEYAPGQVAKLAANYDYQACEPDDWYDSKAYRVLTVLRKDLLENLPEYDSARWGL